MEQYNDRPTSAEVRNFITAHEVFVRELTGNPKFESLLRAKDLGHFCAATWICKRNGVTYMKFLAQLHRKHRKMEDGKVVPPHQLSTEYAEEAAKELTTSEYLNSPEGRAKTDALINHGLPLEHDRRYRDTLESIGFHPNTFFEGNEGDVLYVAERQIQTTGYVDDNVKAYMTKFRISFRESL